MKNAVALILGGGRGTRLAPLTSIRSKPAVPLGGMYRLIDIPISNCLNSDINRIFVLTQFMSVSLHNHINNAYQFDNFSGGFVELLAAQETPSAGSDWYQGTADAVRKNLIYFNQSDIEYVVILSGDQLYRMDYSKLIETHIAKGADVTIACLPVTREDARGFGVMQLDDHGQVTGFVEKPQTDEEIDAVRTDPEWIRTQGIDPQGRDCLASMGIYVFGRKLLNELLQGSTSTDFGKEVFPEAIKNKKVYTHLFDDYWEDIGTIRSFYESNLNLASEKPPFNLVEGNSPIYTHARFLPPTKMGNASVKRSLISAGCEIGDGVEIENSVIGIRTKIAPGVKIKDSIIMGAAYYNSERPAEVETDTPLGIGEGSIIEGSIIDLDCRIGKNVRIINGKQRTDTSLDHPTCVIRDGIPILIKKAILPDGWTLDDEV
jgi:glucose-1-phosphate adenylyltransferase